MKENKLYGTLILLALIGLGVISSLNGSFSLFSKLLSFAVWATVIFIALLVAVVLYFAFKKPADQPKSDNNKLMRETRVSLAELRNTAMVLQNPDIKSHLNKVCDLIEIIIRNIKAQKGSIQKVRQLFNTYLPALQTIVNKYSMLEKSSQADETLQMNMVQYLERFTEAMTKYNASIFEDDKIDLSIEMKALMMACKKDGLITNTVNFEEKDEKIVLKL